MPLPAVEAPLATVTRASDVQGGTSVDAEHRLGGWPYLTAAGLLGAALLGYFIFGGSDEPKQRESPVTIDEVEEDLDEQPATTRPARPALPQPEKDAERTTALETVEATLNASNLWATVRAGGENDRTVSVRSASCDDDEIRPLLREAGPDLKTAGFVLIQCVAEHGELIFEQPL